MTVWLEIIFWILNSFSSNTRCYFIISLHQCYCWKIKSCSFIYDLYLSFGSFRIFALNLIMVYQISSPPLISPLQLEVFHLFFFSNSEKCTFTVVQSLSHVHLFATPWTAARQASLSFTSSQSPPKLMSSESVLPSNHFILCHPLLLLPSIFASIRIFSNELALCIRWPKQWSFSFSISPSNEY